MSNDNIDYEDLAGMQLTAAELDDLVSPGGECIFNWTNRDGYPVGVVVAYVWRDGKFWTTCAARRSGCRRCAHGHNQGWSSTAAAGPRRSEVTP